MVEIRRKPVTLSMLDNLRIPSELEQIEFSYALSAEDLDWLKLGHVSEMGIDFTSVYVQEDGMLYFLSSLIHNGKGIHIFICRLYISETDDGAVIEYAEVGKNIKDKERTRFLSAWTKIGFSIVRDDEPEQYQVNPKGFERGINSIIAYAKISSKPSSRPENITIQMPVKIRTSVERYLTHQEFFKLSWGMDVALMDGRWLAYMEDMTMYWHRSWTGDCHYQLQFKQADSGYLLYEIVSSGHEAFEPLGALQLVDDLLGQRIYEYEIVEKT